MIYAKNDDYLCKNKMKLASLSSKEAIFAKYHNANDCIKGRERALPAFLEDVFYLDYSPTTMTQRLRSFSGNGCTVSPNDSTSMRLREMPFSSRALATFSARALA